MPIHHLVSLIFLSIGFLFILLGTVGMLFYRNLFVRLTISGLIDTIGFLLVVIGLIFRIGWQPISLKLLLLIFIFLFLNPISNHMIGRSAYRRGYHPEKER